MSNPPMPQPGTSVFGTGPASSPLKRSRSDHFNEGCYWSDCSYRRRRLKNGSLSNGLLASDPARFHRNSAKPARCVPGMAPLPGPGRGHSLRDVTSAVRTHSQCAIRGSYRREAVHCTCVCFRAIVSVKERAYERTGTERNERRNGTTERDGDPGRSFPDAMPVATACLDTSARNGRGELPLETLVLLGWA